MTAAEIKGTDEVGGAEEAGGADAADAAGDGPKGGGVGRLPHPAVRATIAKATPNARTAELARTGTPFERSAQSCPLMPDDTPQRVVWLL